MFSGSPCILAVCFISSATAELLLHSERVARHISGVEQALSELGEGLEVLTDNQNGRVDRLIDDVKRIERLYTAATKSSRYMSYSYISVLSATIGN